VGGPQAERAVLTLNCGSTSLKFALFADGDGHRPRIEGQVEAIGAEEVELTAKVAGEPIPATKGGIEDHRAAAARVFDLLTENGVTPHAVGHRIVHGGPSVRDHCRIDADVLKALEQAKAFAPLHVPAALAVVDAARTRYGEAVHVACLDTAFHQTMPEVARRLPIAARRLEPGVERYGFHGLSCESILHQLGAPPPRRLIVAHLGGGASVTAIKDGRSIDTSMGLTPTGGVMMETRTGDLDPGLLIYLLREGGLDADALEALVDRQGGLLGVSGLSGDVRQLRAATMNAEAQLALAMFVASVRKQIAAMTAVLDGLDLLVFTGGLGEHDAPTREAICAGLGWISPALQLSSVRALPANEEERIAHHARRIAGQSDLER
jgi:acetate kinase